MLVLVVYFIMLAWMMMLCAVVGLRPAVRGFNLDTVVPIVKRSDATYDTYFGFSVAAHRLQQSDQTV